MVHLLQDELRVGSSQCGGSPLDTLGSPETISTIRTRNKKGEKHDTTLAHDAGPASRRGPRAGAQNPVNLGK